MYCSLNSVGSLTHIDTEATLAHHTQQSRSALRRGGKSWSLLPCTAWTNSQKLLWVEFWLRGKYLGEPPRKFTLRHDLYPAEGATYLSGQLMVTSGTCGSPELVVAIRELALFCVSPSTWPGFQKNTTITVMFPECPLGLGHYFGCPFPGRKISLETQRHYVR